MKLKYIFFLCMAAVLTAGCYSEDDIVPTDDSQSVDRFTFPQGDNSWDNDIVDIYNTFGVEMIYKGFTNTDINRSWTSYSGTFTASELASDSEVEYTVNVLKNHIFAYLTPEITKGVFKPYIYLTRNLRRGESGSFSNRKLSGLDSWAVCLFWDGRNTPTTKSELFQFRGAFLYDVLNDALSNGNIAIPDEYNEGFDYTTAINSYDRTSDNYYLKRGFVSASILWGYFYPVSSIRSITAASNFFQYIHLGMYYSDEEIDSRYPRSTYPFLRSKLDYVVNYMKTQYNIDLKAIHNGPDE